MTTTPPSETPPETPPKKKASSVRHPRAIQRDRSKRPTVASPDEHMAERLTEIVHPATLAQLDYYRQLGLRERILTLPVMVALVLSLIWRQIGGVCEVVRLGRGGKPALAPPPARDPTSPVRAFEHLSRRTVSAYSHRRVAAHATTVVGSPTPLPPRKCPGASPLSACG